MGLTFEKLKCKHHYTGYAKINSVVCQKYHNYGFLPNIRPQKFRGLTKHREDKSV